MKNRFESPKDSLTIGVFAQAAGVNVETIRFYQRKGLLAQPNKPLGSIRRYGGDDVARIKFVKSAQQLGFSLDEIAELLRLQDGTQCDAARAGRTQTGAGAAEIGRPQAHGVGADRLGGAMQLHHR